MGTNTVKNNSTVGLMTGGGFSDENVGDITSNLVYAAKLGRRRLKKRSSYLAYFDEVFNYTIAKYENLKMPGQDYCADFALDSSLKNNVKQSAYEEFLDELPHIPEYIAIAGVMHRLIGVIRMSDDCDLDDDVFRLLEDSVCDFIAEKEKFRVEALITNVSPMTFD